MPKARPCGAWSVDKWGQGRALGVGETACARAPVALSGGVGKPYGVRLESLVHLTAMVNAVKNNFVFPRIKPKQNPPIPHAIFSEADQILWKIPYRLTKCGILGEVFYFFYNSLCDRSVKMREVFFKGIRIADARHDTFSSRWKSRAFLLLCAVVCFLAFSLENSCRGLEKNLQTHVKTRLIFHRRHGGIQICAAVPRPFFLQSCEAYIYANKKETDSQQAH